MLSKSDVEVSDSMATPPHLTDHAFAFTRWRPEIGLIERRPNGSAAWTVRTISHEGISALVPLRFASKQSSDAMIVRLHIC